ncbi:hypothetical protein [Picosynechococcus sp. NKBG15041c]|uniref:hypothetical protein n=1 Tax=Picosynechococcus sp. NKBG15041c TaxID=1407650 RepID=UPI000464E211|nr:hypothetical protein [Picosynechococcus sp. NKBG15041c]
MKDRPIIEATLENVEALIDILLDNDILKGIPVVGTAIKCLKGAEDIRDRLFAAKLSSFLKSLENVGPELKEKIRQRVAEDPDQSRKVGETILLVIDRLADLEKSDIIAKIFIAYAFGYLKPNDFQRIVQAVDQAFIADLKLFLASHNLLKKGLSQEVFLQALYPSGLTEIVGGKTFDTAGEIYFKVSKLGNQLINAFNHGNKLSQQDRCT